MSWCPECGGLYDPADAFVVREQLFDHDGFADQMVTLETCSQACMLAWLNDTSRA